MQTSRRFMLAGVGAAAFAACARAQGVPRNWSPPAGAFAAASKYSAERRGVSLLVMRAGRVLYQDYPSPGGGAKGWELASGTKSFTGVMAALASADGLLDIDEPCAKTLPEWENDARNRITIRHLLTLTSGLEIGGATARPESYAEAITAKAVHAPGAVFEYGPTPFQAFGEVLTRKLKSAGKPIDPVAWIQTRLFDSLGVKPVDWKRGRSGDPHMPQGAHLTAPDWAKFGQWVFDGARGADPKVIHALFESTSANPGYGLSWWLLRPGLIAPNPRAGVNMDTIGEAALKEDIVMAAGAGDQRLYLIRRRNLIVARQANQIIAGMRPRALKWQDGEFLSLLLRDA